MGDPTKQELYERAQELDVPGRPTMDREELEEAVKRANRPNGLRGTEPPAENPTGNWFRDHLLNIILASLFLISLIGHQYIQYRYDVDQAVKQKLDA